MPTFSHKENIAAATEPAAVHDGSELLAARDLCRDVRLALDSIVDNVTAGARDLQGGQTWSPNLERFELASMEQARILAKFPIGTTDARFGALVHRARASFVAFRETVRREIIGAVDGATEDAAIQLALKKVASRSALTSESLNSVEQAISRYWVRFHTVLRDGDPHGDVCREMAR